MPWPRCTYVRTVPPYAVPCCCCYWLSYKSLWHSLTRIPLGLVITLLFAHLLPLETPQSARKDRFRPVLRRTACLEKRGREGYAAKDQEMDGWGTDGHEMCNAWMLAGVDGNCDCLGRLSGHIWAEMKARL